MSKLDQMKAIYDELVSFKGSPLFEYRKANGYLPVLGEGSYDAKIMFVGEAPGRSEAISGKPFCGAAGRFLTALLESIGLSREDAYITNIVKDRPEDNRDPTEREIELYAPFLDRQIEIVRPRVIATLGRHSMGYVMKRYGLDHKLEPMSKIHGKAFETEISFDTAHTKRPLPITIVTLYHPAAALYNGGMRETLFKDFQILKKYGRN